MKTIWKYEIAAAGRQSISMPVNAEVLCVQMQQSRPCIWAMVDTQAAQEEREFVVLGTGQNAVPESVGPYIGTFQTAGGSLVFHIFESRAT